MLDRTEYQRKYYLAHKEQKKASYNAQKEYLRKIEVKKTLKKLKKQIGVMSYNLILDELEKLEIKKGN